MSKMLKLFWPRYFDAARGEWRTVANQSSFSKSNLRDACALCGWGRHMAIHSKPDVEKPTGTIGLHGWHAPQHKGT